MYTIQQSALYAVDYSIIIGDSAGMTVNASVLANNNNLDTYQQTYGSTKTLRISEVLDLPAEVEMTTALRSGSSEFKGNSTYKGGFSIYFIQSLSDAESK